MSRTLNRKLIYLLSFLFLLFVSLSFVTSFAAKAETPAEPENSVGTFSFAEGDFAMVNGASLRIAGDYNGLRFMAGFKETETFDMSKVVSFGMLIGPSDLVGERLDKGDVTEGNAVDINYENTPEDGKKYLYNASDAEGNIYKVFGGSLTNIYINNYDRDFVGVAYYETATETVYASVNGTENVRSLSAVAGNAKNSAEYAEGDDSVRYLIDSYANKNSLGNGSFKYGLNGWTTENVTDQDNQGRPLGYVVDRVNAGAGEGNKYWYICADYGTESDKLFSFANTVQNENDENSERVTGALKSSPFVVADGAWMTFSWGGGENTGITIEIRDENTDEVLFVYDNTFENSGKAAATVKRAINLGGLGLSGKAVYIVFRDNATGGYGGIVVSDIVTDALSCPDGYTDLTSLLRNGSFAFGTDGWSMSYDGERPLGFVVSKTNNYVGGVYEYMTADYGTLADKVFSFVNTDDASNGQINNESVKGTLKSSPYIVAENSYINMSWGGGVGGDVRLEIRKYSDDSVLATYYNTDNNTNALQGATIKRSFDTSSYAGELVYLAFVDDSTSNYGGIVVSDITVNAAERIAGEGFSASVANGSFTTGNLDGWDMQSADPDGGDRQLGFVVGRTNVGKDTVYHYMCADYGTVSNKLFSFANTDQNAADINHEKVTGTLKSSVFVVNPGAWMTFSWGGGEDGNIYMKLYHASDDSFIASFNNLTETAIDAQAHTMKRAINLSELVSAGEKIYIVFEDTTGEKYGGIVVSDIVTSAESCPEGYTALTKLSYDA